MKLDTRQFVIPTWTEPATLEYCNAVARRSNWMVEVGTYMGASARAMLLGNPDLHLWAVDKFMVFGTEQITRLFLHDWIVSGHCEIVVGDSNKAAEILPHMRGKLDAVWIDDGHAVEDLQRDIAAFLPLLRPGGELFGHDWEGDNDVARGVRSMIPAVDIQHPVPRVWKYIKP